MLRKLIQNTRFKILIQNSLDIFCKYTRNWISSGFFFFINLRYIAPVLKRGNSSYNNSQHVLYDFACALPSLQAKKFYLLNTYCRVCMNYVHFYDSLTFLYTLNTKSGIREGCINLIWFKEFRLKGNVQWNISEKGACPIRV